MAGYYNYSMSNNAVSAYADGEKPLSKWTKSEIIETLVSEGVSSEKIDLIKSFPQKLSSTIAFAVHRGIIPHHTTTKQIFTKFSRILLRARALK